MKRRKSAPAGGKAAVAKQPDKPIRASASPLTHIDQRGQARMVDVTEKGATERTAVAEGRVIMRK